MRPEAIGTRDVGIDGRSPRDTTSERKAARGRHPWASLLALLALAVLALVPIAAVVAAVSVNYIRVAADGPPKAWGKGAGDLDGDGKSDVVVGSFLGGLYWYENPGWVRHIIDQKIRTQEDLEVVDLNRDGDMDVVAVTLNGVTWFENQGRGANWTAHTLVTGRDLHDLEVADLDGDGKLDLVGRDQYPNGDSLFLWRQLSLSNWAPTTIGAEAGTGLVVASLDGTGKPDIATNKYWFKNNSANGRFDFTRIAYNPTGEKDAYVAAGRINADADVDLVVTPSHPTIGGTHAVAWFENPGNGSTPWTRHLIENDVQSVVHFAAVADLDGDGKNDVVTAMTQLGTNPKIKLYSNPGGTGNLSEAQTLANSSSHMMKIIDVGGKKSLFGADYNDNGQTPIDIWQLSTTANPTPAQFVGCWRDQGTIGSTNGGRDLNKFLLPDRSGMTPQLCNRTCDGLGYRYAGTQAGYQCFCDNSFGTYGAASNCTTECTGDPSQKCGGTWANGIFDLR